MDEVLAMTNEVITVLSTDEETEFSCLGQISNLVDQLDQAYIADHEAIKDVIMSLTEKCNEEENAVLVESEKAKESEVSHLTQKLESTERQKQKIENELESVEEQQKQMEMQLDELEHEKEELEDTTSRVLPSIRHDLNLYKYLTGIHWQYGCPPNEVKGYISSRSHVKTFNLDKQHNSQFFIANYLWENIACDW